MGWVNLLPWRERQRTRRRRRGILVMLLFIFPGGSLLASLYRQLSTDNLCWQRRVEQSQMLMVQMSKLEQKLQRSQQQYQILLARQRRQQQQRWRNLQWYQFSLALPQIMPETLWLTSLQQEKSIFRIRGFCRDIGDIGLFHQQLETENLFQQVNAGMVKRVDNGSFEFSFQADLKKEEEENE